MNELIQEMYRKMKNDSGNDTETIFAFIKWLHEEKGQATLLLDMDDLGDVERKYIECITHKN